MTIAIIGSRTATNAHYPALCTLLETVKIDKIVSGGAKGADALGARYAVEHNIPLEVYLPDWNRLGTRAGLERNTQIVDTSDAIIALWNYESTGTADTLRKAKKAGKNVVIININDNENI